MEGILLREAQASATAHLPVSRAALRGLRFNPLPLPCRFLEVGTSVTREVGVLDLRMGR
jgi:hypothetical protein